MSDSDYDYSDSGGGGGWDWLAEEETTTTSTSRSTTTTTTTTSTRNYSQPWVDTPGQSAYEYAVMTSVPIGFWRLTDMAERPKDTEHIIRTKAWGQACGAPWWFLMEDPCVIDGEVESHHGEAGMTLTTGITA